jgi:N-methylhydantoinase A
VSADVGAEPLAAASGRAFRVGIDVGGTFTHAVAVDNNTLEVVAHAVTPTSHQAPEGVARGIVEVFTKLLGLLAEPYRVVFLAHSTTQATNALLEGDVAKVGIVGLGSGLEAVKARADMTLPPIELAPGKLLHNQLCFVSTADGQPSLGPALKELRASGVEAVVAAEAFSVDDPRGEQAVMQAAVAAGLPACGTHEMTGLYGLRVRTRTAVINASILPRMIETAHMTQKSLQALELSTSMMIMRSDGGVMSLDEVRRRPVLTLLSGPAAGIAAALMYLRASDALFLEVGGTSTDVCLIKDGRAAISSASIGGNPTYLRTLDSRTLGIAGGSMVGPDPQGGFCVGPRSAHLAGLPYATFAAPAELQGELRIEELAPLPNDPPYFVVVSPQGVRYAITTTCAANLLGYIQHGMYAYGHQVTLTRVFEALARHCQMSPEQAARDILERAAERVLPTLKALLAEYGVQDRKVRLLGGGGGAGAIVPYVAEKLGMAFEIAPHAEVISAIGAAMALVKETIEKSMAAPSQADLAALRAEAERAVVAMGADAETVEVVVEVDAQKNLVRATATGSVAFVASDLLTRDVGDEERIRLVREAAPAGAVVRPLGSTGSLYLYESTVTQTVLWLFKRTRQTLWVLDARGDIKLQVLGGRCAPTTGERLFADLERELVESTSYGDAGARLPAIVVARGRRLTDLSALQTEQQILTLAREELTHLVPDERAFFVLRPPA